MTGLIGQLARRPAGGPDRPKWFTAAELGAYTWHKVDATSESSATLSKIPEVVLGQHGAPIGDEGALVLQEPKPGDHVVGGDGIAYTLGALNDYNFLHQGAGSVFATIKFNSAPQQGDLWEIVRNFGSTSTDPGIAFWLDFRDDSTTEDDRKRTLKIEVSKGDGSFSVREWYVDAITDLEWHTVGAAWNESTVRIWVDGRLIVDVTGPNAFSSNPANYQLTAMGTPGATRTADISVADILTAQEMFSTIKAQAYHVDRFLELT